MKPTTSDHAYERAKRELEEQEGQAPPSLVDLLLADIGIDTAAPTSAPTSPLDAFTDALNSTKRPALARDNTSR